MYLSNLVDSPAFYYAIVGAFPFFLILGVIASIMKKRHQNNIWNYVDGTCDYFATIFAFVIVILLIGGIDGWNFFFHKVISLYFWIPVFLAPPLLIIDNLKSKRNEQYTEFGYILIIFIVLVFVGLIIGVIVYIFNYFVLVPLSELGKEVINQKIRQ